MTGPLGRRARTKRNLRLPPAGSRHCWERTVIGSFVGLHGEQSGSSGDRDDRTFVMPKGERIGCFGGFRDPCAGVWVLDLSFGDDSFSRLTF